MNARRRKQPTAPAPRTLRVALAVLAGVLVVLAAGVAWMRSPAGRLVLADRGVSAAEAWAHDHLQESLLLRLRELGVPADSIRVEPDPAGGPTLVRLPATRSILELNRQLSAAAEAAGGTVHRGERHRDPEGEWMELLVGTRQRLTHRIVARPTRVAPPPPPLPRGQLAIVIDDLGHNLNGLTRRALALPGPVTFAVLPDLQHSARALTEIRRAGQSAFLHLPMEPDAGTGYEAGEPQVRVGIAAAEVRAIVEACLDGLPGVVGVNNHMGSAATRSRPEMVAVMEVLAVRGLPFLDSQTTSQSVAHVAAAAAGVPTLRNDIFLDADDADQALVRERLDYLVRKARQRGWAVGIGHVNEATVAALEAFLPTLAGGDVELVAVADLIHARTR